VGAGAVAIASTAGEADPDGGGVSYRIAWKSQLNYNISDELSAAADVV
jgi:hypothetical protein